MFPAKHRLLPLDDRGPLRVMFVITTMPVGGAEKLLVELIRGLDRSKFIPELCCLKYLDVLGEVMAREVPTYTNLLANKYDVAVLPRLVKLLRHRRIDAVVTVGTGGDKMFWGRLAARIAGVPVICSALHSTGLPDHVEFLNRLLTPVTDAFVAVAEPHGRYLAEHEGCPRKRVCVIPNGVDTERFRPRGSNPELRASLGLKLNTPVVGIVAALRPEKNHELFLQAAADIRRRVPDAQMLVIGDGARRSMLEALSRDLGTTDCVQFLGTRHDVPELIAEMNVVALTSHMEANPVSILEALSVERPVVAPRVGSIPETVHDGRTGYTFEAGNRQQLVDRVVHLLQEPATAARMGQAGREMVLEQWSIAHMVRGYERMMADIYTAKAARAERRSPPVMQGGMPPSSYTVPSP